MEELYIEIECSALGAADVKGPAIMGKLYAIEYQPISIATAAILTLTCLNANEAPKPLFYKTNMGTSHVWFYPRDLAHAAEDGSALTGTAAGDRVMPIMAGRPRVVISGGGVSTTGHLILYYEK